MIWGEALGAIARTGLGFTDNLYERERFEEVLKIAADSAAEKHDRDQRDLGEPAPQPVEHGQYTDHLTPDARLLEDLFHGHL